MRIVNNFIKQPCKLNYIIIILIYLDEKDSVWTLKNGDDGDETYVSV